MFLVNNVNCCNFQSIQSAGVGYSWRSAGEQSPSFANLRPGPYRSLVGLKIIILPGCYGIKLPLNWPDFLFSANCRKHNLPYNNIIHRVLLHDFDILFLDQNIPIGNISKVLTRSSRRQIGKKFYCSEIASHV